MYVTDLMEKILTSKSGNRMIQRVTPKYGDGYVALWLFQILGLSNDTVAAMVDDFELQIVPQTATWSLPWWERSMGLPVDESLSTEERRLRIIEKRRQREPMNPARIEQIVSALAGGADVKMNEYAGKNRFTLHIDDIPSEDIIIQIQRRLKQIKQSHRTFNLQFETNETMDTSVLYCGTWLMLESGYEDFPIMIEPNTSENMPEAVIYYNVGYMSDMGYEDIVAAQPEAKDKFDHTQYAGTAMVDAGYEDIEIL